MVAGDRRRGRRRDRQRRGLRQGARHRRGPWPLIIYNVHVVIIVLGL